MGEIFASLCLPALLQRADSLAAEDDWAPFRSGVSIRWLYQTHPGGPAAALLRYEPGAAVPLHEHLGYEHIVVLQGSQSDERGHYPAARSWSTRRAARIRCGARAGASSSSSGRRGIRVIDPDPR